MLNKKFRDIGHIYQSAGELQNFKQIFMHLEKLNQILARSLPQNLVTYCHVGAFDNDKSIIVVYTNNQQALHLVKGISNKILQAFYAANYTFNNLLIKVQPNQKSQQQTIKFKSLDSKAQNSLTNLAKSINRPDLIFSNDQIVIEEDDDEITF